MKIVKDEKGVVSLVMESQGEINLIGSLLGGIYALLTDEFDIKDSSYVDAYMDIVKLTTHNRAYDITDLGSLDL